MTPREEAIAIVGGDGPAAERVAKLIEERNEAQRNHEQARKDARELGRMFRRERAESDALRARIAEGIEGAPPWQNGLWRALGKALIRKKHASSLTTDDAPAQAAVSDAVETRCPTLETDRAGTSQDAPPAMCPAYTREEWAAELQRRVDAQRAGGPHHPACRCSTCRGDRARDAARAEEEARDRAPERPMCCTYAATPCAACPHRTPETERG